MKNYFFIAFFLFLLKEGNSQAIEWPVDTGDLRLIKNSNLTGCRNEKGAIVDSIAAAVFYIDKLLNERNTTTEKLKIIIFHDTTVEIKVSFETPLGSRKGTIEISAYIYGKIDSNGILLMPKLEEIHSYAISLRAPVLSKCELGFVLKRYPQLQCSGSLCTYGITKILTKPRAYQNLDALIYRFIDNHPIEFYEVTEEGQTVKLE